MAQNIQRGRREEGRARHPRYYALNDHPNFRQFRPRRPADGDASASAAYYEDAVGREYRMGPVLPDSGLQRVYVRLPGRDMPWFDTNNERDTRIMLQPTSAAAPMPREIRIADAFLMPGRGHRTGHIHIYM
jgi:hypothetical protein